jgi:pSer/pThr/pTyr-binding forkhead associated (FHA) protein
MAGLEVWGPRERIPVALVEDRYNIGKAADMDVVVPGDAAVSAVHAAIERHGSRWLIRDLDSKNGTFVNGERILGERGLRDRDEILLGKTRVVFYAHGAKPDPTTDVLRPAPELTPRQRDVLRELVRPLLSGNTFTEPASVAEIAQTLFVTEADVKQHLSRLYLKFDIPTEPGKRDRRIRLANEAVQRAAVTMKDLRVPDEP